MAPHVKYTCSYTGFSFVFPTGRAAVGNVRDQVAVRGDIQVWTGSVTSILGQIRRSCVDTEYAGPCSARYVILLSALYVMAILRIAGALGDTRVRGAIY